MFDVDVLDGEEVFVAEHAVAVKGVNNEVNVVEEVGEVINTAKQIINAAQVSPAGDKVSAASAVTTVSGATTTTATITTVGGITLAQALEEIKSTKPKEKGIDIQELGYKIKDLNLQEFDSIQEMFDKAFKRENIFEDFKTKLVKGKEKRAGKELIQEITKKQKVEDYKEIAELIQFMEITLNEEEVAIDVIPLSVKSPKIVDWKIYKE
nr:hypothetical protein [Tanacetum cinerariifolium]